jgi:hypothetical protein
MKAIERLEELLDEKDSRINDLERELREATDRQEADWEWARHSTRKMDADNLPVPRLEMRWVQESEDGYMQRWDYALVYRHTLDHLVVVPLGQTRTQGGRGEPPIYGERLQTPFRDGVHICRDTEHLGIPAFGICDGKVWRLWMQDGKCEQELLPANVKSTHRRR